jgi:hypothetical protein
MRKLLLALAELTVLGGCISMIENAYDDQARSECDRESGARDRGACYDRVDQNRRDNR